MNTPTPRTDAATYPADCLFDTLVTNRDCARALERELTALAAERDQLRDEVERLTKQAVFDGDHIHTLNAAFATRAEVTDANARAERAEASLHAMRLVCGTTDADKFTTWVDRANARAERAEAELAAANERLRSEAMDDYASIKDLQRELATEREKVRVLRSSLENLCDEQNGPPLEVNRDQWQLAMDESRLAIAATEGAK